MIKSVYTSNGDLVYDTLQSVEPDEGDYFIEFFNRVKNEIHETALDKGWWDETVKSGDACKIVGQPHTFALSYRSENGPFYLECQDCGIEMNDPDQIILTLWKAAAQRNKAELIALIHSELSEALEGLRKGNPANDQLKEYNYAEVELADTIIRILDMAGRFNWRVGEAIIDKIKFNKDREKKHGKLF